jgi:hypothetical protein
MINKTNGEPTDIKHVSCVADDTPQIPTMKKIIN